MTARNLALAEQQPQDLVAPCSGCLLALKKTQHYVAEYPTVAQQVHDALRRGGLRYTGTVKVRHPLDVLVNDIGLPGVVVSRDYKYMCSDPGQELIQTDIKEQRLNRVVVASCSPLLHEHTFRGAAAPAALAHAGAVSS